MTLRIASTAPPLLWGTAAAVAFSLHLGAAAALFYTIVPALDDDTGAPAIEISLAPTSAPVENSPDLPPGPQADESAASAAVAEQKPPVENDVPKITHVEGEDADVQRAIEKQEKTLEKPQTITEQKAVAANASEASEATAAPKSDAPAQALVTAAPVAGAGVAASQRRATWQKSLMAHLNRNKRYPADARRKSGESVVHFTLDRLGHVVGASIKTGSGEAAFDEAALAMMRRADPVPAPPPEIADETLTFDVPVIFRAPG